MRLGLTPQPTSDGSASETRWPREGRRRDGRRGRHRRDAGRAGPGQRRLPRHPGRGDYRHRRAHGPARQDLPHQRLLDVHHLAQADRGGQAPEHRRAHQRRRAGPGGRSRATSASRVRKRPRFVDLDKCNACGDCLEKCPVALPSEFDQGTHDPQGDLQALSAGHPRRHGDQQGRPPALRAGLPGRRELPGLRGPGRRRAVRRGILR